MSVEATPQIGAAKGLSRGALSWALHEGVRDPFVIMIVIYIFQPYFARVIVGDAVKGQELIAFSELTALNNLSQQVLELLIHGLTERH